VKPRIEAIQKLDAQLREHKVGRGTKIGLYAQLDAQLKEKEAALSGLHAHMKEREAALSEFQAKYLALDTQLKVAVDELRQVQQELLQVKSSWSWKLTRPLRWCRARLMGKK